MEKRREENKKKRKKKYIYIYNVCTKRRRECFSLDRLRARTDWNFAERDDRYAVVCMYMYYDALRALSLSLSLSFSLSPSLSADTELLSQQ